MLNRRRTVGVPLLLGLVAYALAFIQRPGLATADTKINLHVDPGRFLGDVASMWTSTGQLGGVPVAPGQIECFEYLHDLLVRLHVSLLGN